MDGLYWLALIALLAQTVARPHPATDESEVLLKPDFIEAEIQYTASHAEKTVTLIHNVLQHLPNTALYDKHRQSLQQLLQCANDFKRPGLCHTKINAFSRSWTAAMVKYLQPNASPECKEILKLLEEYGLRAMMIEANAFLFRIVSGKIGPPVVEGTPEFSKFLEKEC